MDAKREALVPEMAARFEALSQQEAYQTLRDDIASRIKMWGQSGHHKHSIRPYFDYRNYFYSPRFYVSDPYIQYGIDLEGRILQQQYGLITPGRAVESNFYTYEVSGRVEHVTYEIDKQGNATLANLEWAIYTRAEPAFSVAFRKGQEQGIPAAILDWGSYTYSNTNKLIQIDGNLKWFVDNAITKSYDRKTIIEYSSDQDHIAHLVEYHPSYRKKDHTIYFHTDDEGRDLFQRAKEEVVKIVIATVKTLSSTLPPGRIYAMAIDNSDYYADPNLYFGYEIQRDKWLLAEKSPEETSPYEIWLPLVVHDFDFSLMYSPDHRFDALYKLMEYCSSHNFEGFGNEADRFYMSVAHDLNRMDWNNLLNVTPDFTVVYVEHEMGGWDVADGMCEYVPPERILQFEALGWLPKLIPVKLPFSPLKVSILD